MSGLMCPLQPVVALTFLGHLAWGAFASFGVCLVVGFWPKFIVLSAFAAWLPHDADVVVSAYFKLRKFVVARLRCPASRVLCWTAPKALALMAMLPKHMRMAVGLVGGFGAYLAFNTWLSAENILEKWRHRGRSHAYAVMPFYAAAVVWFFFSEIEILSVEWFMLSLWFLLLAASHTTSDLLVQDDAGVSAFWPLHGTAQQLLSLSGREDWLCWNGERCKPKEAFRIIPDAENGLSELKNRPALSLLRLAAGVVVELSWIPGAICCGLWRSTIAAASLAFTRPMQTLSKGS